MYIVFWALICLLASIGAVQALSWIVCTIGRPDGDSSGGRAYQVIPLAREAGQLEQQLRWELHLIRWSSTTRPGQLILLDTGLDEEAREVCRNILAGIDGIIICRPEEVAGLLCTEERALAESL